MVACDELFFAAPPGTPEELFGLTCGGIVHESLNAGGDCELLLG
jgi:hypothetical protein